MTLPKINTFYYVWFEWVDPIILLPSILALIFKPQVMIEAFIPPTLSTYNPDQGFLVHQLAAMFAFVAIMLAGVLRLSKDIEVWRTIIAGILLIDVAMLLSTVVSLKQQGRLSFSGIRPEDWGNIVFILIVTIIRILFLAGVGVRYGAKSKTI